MRSSFFLFLILASTAAAQNSGPAAKAVGVNTAPITLEVFSDYECPACREYYLKTIKPVIEDYASRGRVFVIHRDFPLPNHRYSREAARWANAAARLKRFEPMAEALYRDQLAWSGDGKIEAVAGRILTPAELKQAKAMLRDPQIEAAIELDVSLGKRIPLSQTPTTIITHRLRTYPMTGIVSFPILKRFLDQLLAQ